MEKANAEVTRLTRLVKEYVLLAFVFFSFLFVWGVSLKRLRLLRFERAEMAAEGDRKEDPTILRQPLLAVRRAGSCA